MLIWQRLTLGHFFRQTYFVNLTTIDHRNWTNLNRSEISNFSIFQKYLFIGSYTVTVMSSNKAYICLFDISHKYDSYSDRRNMITIGEFRIKNLMTHKNDSFRLKKIVRIFKYLLSHYLYNKVNYFFVKIDLNKKLYKLVNFKQLRNSNYVSALYKNILFSNDFKITLKRAFRYSYGILDQRKSRIIT